MSATVEEGWDQNRNKVGIHTGEEGRLGRQIHNRKINNGRTGKQNVNQTGWAKKTNQRNVTKY